MQKGALAIGLLLVLYSFQLFSQIRTPQVGYTLIHPDKIETKNFYFTSLIDQSDALKEILSRDEILSGTFSRSKQKRFFLFLNYL